MNKTENLPIEKKMEQNKKKTKYLKNKRTSYDADLKAKAEKLCSLNHSIVNTTHYFTSHIYISLVYNSCSVIMTV